MNCVTASKVFNNYVPVVTFVPPYNNDKHRTYADNTILIYYKHITFLTMIILGIKISIIQIYTYIRLHLLSKKFLISFLMPFLTKDIHIYTMLVFILVYNSSN